MKQPKRILVVEDDQSIILVLDDLLAGEGYEVFTAGDGASGLAAACSAPPDLLLVDVSMPVMDGTEMLRRLRASGRGTLPVVVMSAARPPDLEGLGVAAFVAKPFDVEELLALIERLIGPALARVG